MTEEIVDVDDHHPDAVDAVTRYFAELDERFVGGFDAGDWRTEPDEQRCRLPGGRFIVAYLDGECVGCGGLRTIGSDVGEIKRMWVAPAARGQGLSRRLLEALEDRSRALGHHTVRLDTNDVLDAAIGLYESHGYRRIDRYNDNPYARLWFEKRLDPKRSLRAELQERGRSVRPEALAALHDGLGRFLDRIGGSVLAYRAMAHEPSLDALIDADPDRFALTRSHADLTLSLHRADGPEERHRFGFRQPAPASPSLAPDTIAAVLVPGLAFDPFGGRLGHGAGYYDRFLPTLRPGTPLVGIAPSGWLVDELPTEPHDVAMTHLADEDRVRQVELRRRPD